MRPAGAKGVPVSTAKEGVLVCVAVKSGTGDGVGVDLAQPANNSVALRSNHTTPNQRLLWAVVDRLLRIYLPVFLPFTPHTL